jgi:hypothetical protein
MKRLPKNKLLELRIEEKTYNRIRKLAERHSKGSVSKFVRGILKLYLRNYAKIQKENEKEVGKAQGRTQRVMAARLFVMETETKSDSD